jgi:glycosyltransferase involved in cell wall biosynthesis
LRPVDPAERPWCWHFRRKIDPAWPILIGANLWQADDLAQADFVMNRYNSQQRAWHQTPGRGISAMLESSPKVSVIVPTRDRQALLAETIASVRAQTYSNWELLVIDDNSTDKTAAFVSAISEEEPRVRLLVLDHTQAGAPAARNLGVRQATGSLIIFLDSDDLLAPSCILQRVEVMRQRPQLDFAVFPCQVFRDQPGDLQLLFNSDNGEDDLDRMLKVDVPWQTTCPIWRREALAKIGPWDESAINAQDWEFHIRALVAGLRYDRFGPPDCFWRRPSGQRDSIGKASEIEAKYMRGRVDMIRKMFHFLDSRSLLNESRRQTFAALYFRAAQTLATRASRRDARATWSAARRDGVITNAQFLQGWLFLLVHRWPAARGRMLARLQRSWPAAYFAQPSTTLLRAPMPPVAGAAS